MFFFGFWGMWGCSIQIEVDCSSDDLQEQACMEVDNGFSFLRSARLHRRTSSEGSDRSFQANIVPSPVLREDLYQSSLNFTERLCEISTSLAQVVSTDERREKVRIALEVIPGCKYHVYINLPFKKMIYLQKRIYMLSGNKPRYFGFAFVPWCGVSHGYSRRNCKSCPYSSQ